MISNSCCTEVLTPSPVHYEWSSQLAAMPPNLLLEEAEGVRERADLLGIWSRGGMLPLQPFVLSSTALSHLEAVSRNLHQLVVEYGLALADGDLRRLADRVEWPESERWMLSARKSIGPAVGSSRTDVMVSGGKAQVLEVNIGTCLNGSTSTPVLTETLLATKIGQRLMAGRAAAPGFVDELATWLHAGRRDVNDRVALVSSVDASDEGSTRWAEHQIRMLAARGIAADLVPIEEVDVVGDVLTWGGHVYRQAVRYFMLTGPIEAHRDAVIALEGATGTDVYGGYLSQLFTSKALLADLMHRQDLPPASRRALAHVPWMARLREGYVQREDHRVDPIEWAAANRRLAVLKPSNSFGSRGVTVGRQTSEASWQEAVQTASASGDHVVQDLVEPDRWRSTYWSLPEGALVTVEEPMCLGPFTVDGRAAGTFVQQVIGGGWPGLGGATGGVSLGAAVGV